MSKIVESFPSFAGYPYPASVCITNLSLCPSPSVTVRFYHSLSVSVTVCCNMFQLFAGHPYHPPSLSIPANPPSLSIPINPPSLSIPVHPPSLSLSVHPFVFFVFLDASTHLYKRVCPSVRPLVGPSVGLPLFSDCGN